jgi:predicted outer membrane repeat protein
MNAWMRVCLVLAVLLGAVAPAARVTASPAAPLATIDVTNNNNLGVGSLRQAILDANAAPGPDIIRVTAPNGTVNLASPLPSITDAVTITVSGFNLFQVFKVDGQNMHRGLVVAGGVPVTVIGLTLQRMLVNGNLAGAGIASDGPLTLDHVTIISSTTGGLGGGVSSTGPITVIGGRIEGNTAGLGGGGIHAGGALVINGGLVRNNQCLEPGDCIGGGIYAEAELTLTNTQVISNTSYESGGGLYTGGAAQVSGGRFERNLSLDATGGGLAAAAGLAITGTLFISNVASIGTGGGASLGAGSATLTNVRFEDNHAGSAAGGLRASSLFTPTLTNVDFVHNDTGGLGGGLQANGVLINGGRFERNSAGLDMGGLFAASVTMTGTDFISNTAPVVGGAVAATFVAQGGSFRGNAGGGLEATFSLVLTDTQFLNNTGGAGATSGFQARITGALFVNNSAPASAGGLFASGQTTVSDTQFVNNRGAFAGGLFATGGLTVTNSLFSGNSAEFGANVTGGGLRHESGSGTIVNSLFAGNTAIGGGAALAFEGTGTDSLKHVTIATAAPVTTSAISTTKAIVAFDNIIVASHAVGLAVGGGFVTLNHSLFDANGSDTTGSVAVDANRATGDPRFANPASGDFHLTVGSVAIDAGGDVGIFTDFEGDPRPSGGGFDLGYDEAVLLRLLLPLILR